VTSSAHSELIGFRIRALFFGLKDLVIITDPIIPFLNPATKTQLAYANCVSAGMSLSPTHRHAVMM
jgi:hypothetical protein